MPSHKTTSWIFRPLSRLALFALVGGASACRAERTQIVVLVDTDFAVPSRMGSVRVVVTDPRDRRPIVQPIELKGASASGCSDAPNGARYCIPLSLLLVPNANRPVDAPVELRVEGIAGTDALTGAVLVSRSARMAFAQGQTLRLPMFLARDCEGVICPSDFTCAEGARCVPIDRPPGVVRVDPRTGEPLDAALVDGSLDDAVAPFDAPVRDASSSDRFDASVEASMDAATDAGSDAALDVRDPLLPLCSAPSCPSLASLSAGSDFTCARLSIGRVACWGANDRGQLGRGTSTARSGDGSGGVASPDFVAGVVGSSVLAAGDDHACASTSTGGSRQLVCWGGNRDGALATGSGSPWIPTPTIVAYFTGRGAPDRLALGRESAYALLGAQIIGWGHNADRAIGFGPAVTVANPAPVVAPSQVRSIVARARGMCSIGRSAVQCLGANTGQRFGAVAADGAMLTAPREIDVSLRRDELALAPSFACGIQSDRVSCWGENRRSGVLGRVPAAGAPRTIVVAQPVDVGDDNISDLALGADFALARSNDGAVYCWGSNAEGACAFGTQSADGTVTPATTAPRRIVFPSRFRSPARAIVAGDGHACAFDAGNVVWCWGRNANAQAGQPVTADPRSRVIVTPSPVPIPIPPA
jgi:Regulator of chromosome condensation (RCC1) repeat